MSWSNNTPRDMEQRSAENENVFDAPWQAEALAISVALQDAGLITAWEWAQALGEERNREGLADDGSDYYDCVVAALEALLSRKAVTTAKEIGAMAQSWHRAARATPHGNPIVLENDPNRLAR